MEVNIDAALDAISRSENLEIILVGREHKINEILEKKRFSPPEISIHHAENVVCMDENPLHAARDKKNSIVKSIELLRSGEVDAFMSVGNTGAVAASAMLRLKMLPGINRTPILAVFPTMGGHPIVMLDVGANVDCKPRHLLQFAILGSTFAELIMERNNPRVALISVGEESSKGNTNVKTAHSLLADSSSKLGLNFVGNIEGNDILRGTADVVVCDGFIGNIMLKFTESIYSLVKKIFFKDRRVSILSLIGGLLLYPSLKRTIKDFNYAEYGGAPLLGVNGNIVIGHGSSSSKAIMNALLLAQHMAVANLPVALRKAAKQIEELNHENSNFGDRVVRTTAGAH